MNEKEIMKAIEEMRAEIRTLDERLVKVELKQEHIDEIMDRIAVLDSKIDELLSR